MKSYPETLLNIDDAGTQIKFVGKTMVAYLKKRQLEDSLTANTAGGNSRSESTSAMSKKDDADVSNARPAKRTVSESVVANRTTVAFSERELLRSSTSLPQSSSGSALLNNISQLDSILKVRSGSFASTFSADATARPSFTNRDTTSASSREPSSGFPAPQSATQSRKGKERVDHLFLPDEDNKGYRFGVLPGQQPPPPISRTPSIASQAERAPQGPSRSTLSRSQTMPTSISSTSTSSSGPALLGRSNTMTSTSSGSMGPPPLPSSQRSGRTQFDNVPEIIRRPGRARISESVPNLPVDLPGTEPVYNELGNYVAFEPTTRFSMFEPLTLTAGTYDIVLVLDNREGVGMNREGICERLRSKGIRKEAYWGSGEPGEVVLDAILERKRMDDLWLSIKNGRFHEQKFRLHKSGITRVHYVVEEYDRRRVEHDFNAQSLATVLSQTRAVDDFIVKETKSLHETDQDLPIIPPELIKRYSYLEFQIFLRSMNPNQTYHTQYDCFNDLNLKSGFTTVETTWAKQLLTIHGMSAEKVGLLIKRFRTPRSLYEHFQHEEEREKRELEEEARNPPKGRRSRRFGEALSERIYYLIRTEIYDS
ncbi:hypothetical protein L218DRAFT_996931 [Marasmius fiardii PR-910]|nr:hypothetical protein L218DRAFT_996931 [Marasmius fiardii PR-910]